MGKHVITSKYQIWQDSKIHSVYNYQDKKLEFDKILNVLFPDDNYSISDFQKNTEKLYVHINDFFHKLENETYPSKKKPYPIDYTLDNKSGLFLYTLCKIIKPENVVETGVAYGLSSMYILQALYENKKGSLYSIDSAFSPWQSKEMIGSAIPSHLKSNWNLIYGSSVEKLKKTLASLRSADIFFHDSLHTHKNMIYEFETAWPFIIKNGFLISDDISDNNAFYDFYSNKKLIPFILPQKENSFLGILKKSI